MCIFYFHNDNTAIFAIDMYLSNCGFVKIYSINYG